MCGSIVPLLLEHSVNLDDVLIKSFLNSEGTCRDTSLGVCRGKCSQHTSCWYQHVQRYPWQHSRTCTPGRQHQPSSATSLDSLFQPLAVTCPTFWSSHPRPLRWYTLFMIFSFLFTSVCFCQMTHCIIVWVCSNLRTKECIFFTVRLQFRD